MSASDQPSLEIDCPAAGETIAPGHYAFRISATEALVAAEISVDRGPWRSCRHACGLWWYDWASDGPGPHQLAARGTTHDDRVLNSTFHRFNVSPRK